MSILRLSRVLLSILGALCFVGLARNYQLDDALIYARYVRNAIEGHGLVYNHGEYWNALTSPLYTYLLIAASALSGSVGIGSLLLQGFSLFLLGVFTAQYLQKRGCSFLVQLFGILAIQSSYYVLSTLGLETVLFCSLVLAALTSYEERRYGLLGGVSACLLLTRGESVFLLLFLAVYHFAKGRPLPSVRVFILPVVILTAHFTFNALYFGSIFPHSLQAKAAQGASGYWGEAFAFLKGAKMYLWYFGERVSLLFLLAVLLSAYGFFCSLHDVFLRIFTGFLICYTGFFLALNIPFYHWYYGPIILFGYLCLSQGGELLASKGKVPKVFVGGFFLLIVGLQTAYSVKSFASLAAHPYRKIGEWLEQNTEESARVASLEIGALGWYSHRYIIDVLGLVSEGNAERVAERKLADWLSQYQTDYFVTHLPPWEQEQPALELLRAEERVGAEPVFQHAGFVVWRVEDKK